MPGVKICSFGKASIIARYSVFVGSIAKKGIPLLANCNSKFTENVVFPEPGVPTTNACLVNDFSGQPIIIFEESFVTNRPI